MRATFWNLSLQALCMGMAAVLTGCPAGTGTTGLDTVQDVVADMEEDLPFFDTFFGDGQGDLTPDGVMPECKTDQDCADFFDDLGPCRVALCDEVQKACVTGDIKNYTPCDDSNVCTEGSYCFEGECGQGTLPPLEEQDPCTDLVCDPVTGVSVQAVEGPCDDGNGCTTDDQCVDGACQGTPGDCPCEADADCGPYDDEDLCNGVMACIAGNCGILPGSVVVCDHTKDTLCLANICQPANGGCEMTPRDDGTACDDGNPCTTGDECAGGQCEAGENVCACVTPEDCSEFDDGNPCNGTLDCIGQVCAIAPETVVSCPDGDSNPCVAAVCNPATGQCVDVDIPDGVSCDDGSVCTLASQCADGECGGGAGLTCADTDPCTSDACDPELGCVFTAVDEGTPCDDGDPCTDGESCTDGLCQGGAQVCTTCGNDQCDGDETCESCPVDCGACPSCGDDACNADETCESCPEDCGACPFCGDEACNGLEDCHDCPADCGACPDVCPDGFCTGLETCESCAADCGPCPPACGNGACDEGETCWKCSEDCGACTGDCCAVQPDAGCVTQAVMNCVCLEDPFCCMVAWDSLCVGEVTTLGCGTCQVVCGDGACGAGETCETCPGDCGACTFCGDGLCGQGEGCQTCSKDCGPCGGDCCAPHAEKGCQDPVITGCVCGHDPFCCQVEWDALCVEEVNAFGCGTCEIAVCGDGACGAGETCESCEADCGPCGAGACCQEHPTPGCADPAVSACVCAQDAFCCTTQWDGLCVAEVDSLKCGTCVPDGTCGDGFCSGIEDGGSCCGDCGGCVENGCPEVCECDPWCCTGWDDWCEVECAGTSCGDGVCQPCETEATCPADCIVTAVCGDGICDGTQGETAETCCEDCGQCLGNGCPEVCECDPWCCTGWDEWCELECTGKACGDGWCQPCEDKLSCPVDCVDVEPFCGDGICDPDTETCGSCPMDCGPCPPCENEGDVPDCAGACYPAGWVGDGYCDEGQEPFFADFDCEVFAFDGGDCDGEPEPVCGDQVCNGDETCATCPADCGPCPPCAVPGEIQDCDGVCFPGAWLGDGICDDQGEGEADFACEAFQWDGGDCCPPGYLKDCVGVCGPEVWIGDGICDNGTYGIDFNCDAFQFDGGDCAAPVCGDGACVAPETCATCPQDCGACPCPQGQIPDCDGACFPSSWLGDGVCDDQGQGEADFACEAFQWDGGDCCPPGYIKDCVGVCGLESWLGDGICDDGTYGVDFDCEAFAFDEGDCTIACGDGKCSEGETCVTCPADCGTCPVCPTGELQGCDGACWPESWLGDDICDQGFACEAFAWDEGDCCPTGQVKDCAGVCYSETWVGDGYCDQGQEPWFADFNCEEFEFDGGDCVSCGDGACNGGETCETCPADCGTCPVCPTGQILDCDGACFPEAWLGDDWCDDAGPEEANFACEAFQWDDGDCCPPDYIKDCVDVCGLESWLGDGICDDGTYGVDYNCAAFSFDQGDCESSCPDGQIKGCDGVTCITESWIGDGICDAGLNCEAFQFDGGDCALECPDPENIKDCDGACFPENWLGDGVCDDAGPEEANFACEAFQWDQGDCCPAGQVLGCDGVTCIAESWIGDGWCDEGLNCEAFQFDGGDCGGGCPAGQVLGCDGVTCIAESWIGDGWCDEGLNCAAFQFDGGDCGGGADSCAGKCGQYNADWNCQCDSECENWGDCCADYQQHCGGGCPAGQVLGCDGVTCIAESWIGDGWCDEGLNCAAFQFDGGDCGGGADSCAGKCGQYNADWNCQCDSACGDWGDCCSDYAAQCG